MNVTPSAKGRHTSTAGNVINKPQDGTRNTGVDRSPTTIKRNEHQPPLHPLSHAANEGGEPAARSLGLILLQNFGIEAKQGGATGEHLRFV